MKAPVSKSKDHRADTHWRTKLSRRSGCPQHRAPDLGLCHHVMAATPAAGIALVAATTVAGIPAQSEPDVRLSNVISHMPVDRSHVAISRDDMRDELLKPAPVTVTPTAVPVPTVSHLSTHTVSVRVTVARTTRAISRTVRPVIPRRRLGSSPIRTRILDAAHSVMGVSYRWGSEDPRSGFDCSGLTSWAFRQAGLRLPRVANDQMLDLEATSNPQPGDLVFFLGSGGSAYHVGVYIGPGQMIAAPRRGDVVRIEDIWSTHVSYRSSV